MISGGLWIFVIPYGYGLKDQIMFVCFFFFFLNFIYLFIMSLNGYERLNYFRLGLPKSVEGLNDWELKWVTFSALRKQDTSYELWDPE